MSEQYHLSELAVARNPLHPSHVLPPPFPYSQRILDLGCGAGQTLIAAYPERVAYGIDIDFEALKLGRSLSNQVRFCCGPAESLPYADSVFDVVIARVSLAYTNIPSSLAEIRRVLRPGGTLWMALHSFTVPWRAARTGNWKGKLFFVYILVNSLLLHGFGRQFTFLGRQESFQTTGGMRRALLRAGFHQVSREPGPHFIMTACL